MRPSCGPPQTHQISVEQVAPAAIEHFKKEGIKTAKVNKCLKKQPYPYKVCNTQAALHCDARLTPFASISQVIGSPSSRDR